VESTFTIGFLNDLILITATRDQNFSAIAPGFALPFKKIRPHDRFDTRSGRRIGRRGGSRVGAQAAGRAAAPLHS
jgi:hypothetical protein